MTPVARDTLEHNQLSWEFLMSEFAGDNYVNWPIERRLDAYLRHHELMDVINGGGAYGRVLDCVMANIGPAKRRGILRPGASESGRGTRTTPTTIGG